MREWYHVISAYNNGGIDLGIYDVSGSRKITSLDLWENVLPVAIVIDDTPCEYEFPLLLINCGYYNENLEEILEYEFCSTCKLSSPYSLKELSQELYNYFQVFHPEFKVWRLGIGRI